MEQEDKILTDPDDKTTDPNGTVQDDKPDKGQEIDWSQVDPASIPHDVVQRTGAFGGVLTELQATRQAAQDSNEALKQARDAKGSDSEAGDDDPDALMSRAEVRAEMERRDTARQEADDKKQKTEHTRGLATSMANLKKEYTQDKMPPGLDAESVIREAATYLAANEPGMLTALESADDPAQKMYRYAIANVPSVQKRFAAAQNAKLVESVKSGNPPSGSRDEVADSSELMALIEQPEDELLKQIEQEELS